MASSVAPERGPRGRRGRARALIVGALLAAVAAAGPAGPVGAVAGPVGSVEGSWRSWLSAGDRVVCQFDSGELDEVSGIALSRAHEDILWATNDSGGGPFLYAVDLRDCSIRATLRLLDTPARDHEALAVGTDAQGRDVIWVGDIGDNIAGWPYARIHKVVEPEVLRDASVPVTTYRFTYPDGPVDAEALLAHPDREELWVITKQSGRGDVYAIPSPMDDSRTPMVAQRVGEARALVTDAAMSPDAERYVVRDYLSAEVFTGTPPGAAEARFGLPIQPQGEAITWTADGRGLLIASEGSAELVSVDVPASALGEGGITSTLPRVAGFDIYPYVRIVGLFAAAFVALVVLSRRARRRRRRG